MRSRLPSRLLTACLVAALGGTLTLPSAGATTRHPERRAVTRPAGPTNDKAAARATLATARAVLRGRGTASARGSIGARTPRDATAVMIALRHSLGDLSGADLTAARAILARPGYHDTANTEVPEEHNYTTPEAQPVCRNDTVVKYCIHYVTSTSDSVDTTDTHPQNGVPDYVDTAAGVMDTVYTSEVIGHGYQAPLSDAGVTQHGPDGNLDVYLQDLPDGLYGYCVPDQDVKQTSGYCVLDNDYAASEFGPRNTSTENLQVTAAHEFFHAVQFGYDSQEDTWFMEGTAAWMEDEVYDDVNDNYQYLAESPMTDPYVPIDYFGPFTDDSGSHDYSPYGSWLFFRYLSESQHDPSVIRDIWQDAVGPRSSTQAVSMALSSRASSFAGAWRTFGNWLAYPSSFFQEGAAYNTYGPTFLDSRTTLTRRSPTRTSPAGGLKVDHLTHSLNKFTAGSSLTGKWRLRVSVNMPSKVRGSAARLIVKHRNGTVGLVGIPLNASGNGSRTVAFSRSTVASVELDLVNSSTRYHCGQGAPFACLGNPVDDGYASTFSVRAVR